MVKRLFLDIETSHAIAATFSLYPKVISHDNILQDWHIICASWKWEGEKDVHNSKTYTNNDKKVARALRKAIMEADEIVYHNGKKFDYKKLNTRVVMNDLPPMHKPREIDTLLQARKHFGFTSNRLDYLAKILVGAGKSPVGNADWLAALQHDKKAIDKLSYYCDNDVVILEKVFKKLQPHIDVGYNVNINSHNHVCPRCQSKDLQARGFAYTKTAKYQRYQCKQCRSWSQAGVREKQEKVAVR